VDSAAIPIAIGAPQKIRADSGESALTVNIPATGGSKREHQTESVARIANSISELNFFITRINLTPHILVTVKRNSINLVKTYYFTSSSWRAIAGAIPYGKRGIPVIVAATDKKRANSEKFAPTVNTPATGGSRQER
jgi:hypothetical protein